MKKNIYSISILFILISMSCKKSTTPQNVDVKSKFVGAWVGNWSTTSPTVSPLFKFSLQINADNSVFAIDSAFAGFPSFAGTYTYTTDSLKILYNNGTTWKFSFSNNYTSCAGKVNGTGGTGPVNMINK